jgi:hypothetical protein
VTFDLFGGVRRLRDARAERKAVVEDYYRNEAAPMSAERRARLMAYRPADPLLKACVEASTFLPHNPAEAERIMREALAVTS